MRILVLFAHPVETSFVAALHARIVEILNSHGHEVDDLDLYAEKFDPVLSHQTLIDYLNTEANVAEVGPYVERLRAAEAVVLVFPVWYDGPPAILKGFFERVMLPGVSFRLEADGRFSPLLLKIRRLAAVCVHGASRREASLMGDPVRHLIKNNLGGVIAADARFDYFACYAMDSATQPSRAKFLARVSHSFDGW
jgi:NAD(P)H dehydrogenase (quinone)